MQRNFRIALQLHRRGVAIMRQNLRRRFPDASEDETNQRLKDWLQRADQRSRPDCTGVLRPRALPPYD